MWEKCRKAAKRVCAPVLAHFQSGCSDAAGVCGLAGSEQNTVLLEIFGGLKGGGHVGAFRNGNAAVGNQSLGIIQIQLVLGGAGQSHVALNGPYALALVVFGIGTIVFVLGQAGALDLLDLLDGIQIQTLGVINPAGGIAHSDNLGAQLHGLLRGVDSYVAGAGNGDGFAIQAVAVVLQHSVGEIQKAVTGGLSSYQRAAVGQALTGENALEGIGQALILAEHVSDLTGAGADVAGRHVDIRADIFGKLGHKALAEGHHLAVGFTLGIEIRAALAAADGQAGQGVLEDLLKAQEFDDTGVNRGMETQAALVRSNGVVKLDAVAGVDLRLTLIIHPGYLEFKLAVRLGNSFQKGFPAVQLLVSVDDRAQRV